MPGRTGRLVTNQSESDKIVSPQNLSDLDRLQLRITPGRYTKTDTINIEWSKRIEQREHRREKGEVER